jgi:sulfate permease, SulP family
MPTILQYLTHAIPLVRWLPKYNIRSQLPGDIIASICLALLAAPEAIAYAIIAGLPPAHGLYSAFVAPFAYGVFGTSPQVVISITTISSILTANVMPLTWGGVPLAPFSDAYVAVAGLLAIFAAGMQFLLYITRVGFFTQLISTPVSVGFASGSALLIASSQFSNLLGVPSCKVPGGGSCTFGQALVNIFQNLTVIAWLVPVMSFLAVSFLLLWKYLGTTYLPGKWKLLANTAPLVLVSIGAALMYAFTDFFTSHGVKRNGTMPSGVPWPSIPAVPSPSGSDISNLLLSAIPITLIGYLELLTVGRTIARQYQYSIDENQEMLAVATSNLAVAFWTGYPVTGSYSRSALNASAGATSSISALLSCLILMIVAACLMPALAYVPTLCQAAIIFAVIFKMVEFRRMWHLYTNDLRDFIACIVTLIGVLFFGVSQGLIAGVSIHWFLALTRTLHEKIDISFVGPMKGEPSGSTWEISSEHDSKLPHLSHIYPCVMLLPNMDIQFNNVLFLQRAIREANACYSPKTIVLDCRRISGMDMTGTEMILNEGVDLYRYYRVQLVLFGLSKHLCKLLKSAQNTLHPSEHDKDFSRLSQEVESSLRVVKVPFEQIGMLVYTNTTRNAIDLAQALCTSLPLPSPSIYSSSESNSPLSSSLLDNNDPEGRYASTRFATESNEHTLKHTHDGVIVQGIPISSYQLQLNKHRISREPCMVTQSSISSTEATSNEDDTEDPEDLLGVQLLEDTEKKKKKLLLKVQEWFSQAYNNVFAVWDVMNQQNVLLKLSKD